MRNRLELGQVSASLGVGLVVDRALLALRLHEDGAGLRETERAAVARSAEVISALFLSDVDQMATSSNQAFMEASQADWFAKVLHHQAGEAGQVLSEKDMRQVRRAAGEAVKQAENYLKGRRKASELALYRGLLSVLSEETLHFVDEIQESSEAEMKSWETIKVLA